MKVNGNMSNPTSGTEATKSTRSTSAPGALDGKTKASRDVLEDIGGSSRVELSSRAQDMAKAKELATPSNDIDEAKVARLQKLIDDGNYKVNAETVAEKMLDEHSKMPSS